MSEAVRRGDGIWVTVSQWASAVLCNGLGRYEQALAAARQICDHPPQEFGFFAWSLPNSSRRPSAAGTPGVLRTPCERLAEMTRASGTDWALGMEARSRALLSEGDAAERLYREAIDRLGRTRVRVELARAHLLYGEWLRRGRPACRRPPPVAHRPPDAHRDGSRGVRRARPPRAAGHRRDAAHSRTPSQPTSSPRRKRRSPGSPPTGARTRRSAPSCSSAGAQSSGTCARCTRSSVSAPAGSSAQRFPAPDGRQSAARAAVMTFSGAPGPLRLDQRVRWCSPSSGSSGPCPARDGLPTVKQVTWSAVTALSVESGRTCAASCEVTSAPSFPDMRESCQD